MENNLHINAVAKTILNYRQKGFKTGLICGCFDILHIGHIRLFEFAKKHVDKLLVGIDDDISIKKTKGKNRPVHTQATRLEMLSYIALIDDVFPLNFENKFGIELTEKFENLLLKLKPDVLVTCKMADQFALSKKKICHKHQIEFIPFSKKIDMSTSQIEKIYLESF